MVSIAAGRARRLAGVPVLSPEARQRSGACQFTMQLVRTHQRCHGERGLDGDHHVGVNLPGRVLGAVAVPDTHDSAPAMPRRFPVALATERFLRRMLVASPLGNGVAIGRKGRKCRHFQRFTT